MKKINKLVFIYYLIVGYILIFYKDLSNVTTKIVNDLEYVKCGTTEHIPKPIPQMITVAYTLLIVGTPILLIIFCIITLVKGNSSGKADEIDKAKKSIFRKFLIAAIIFSMGSIVRFVINQVTSNDIDKDTMASCVKCFLYYSETNCPKSTSGYEENNERYKSGYTSNFVNSNIKSKSNKNNSQSTKSGSSTGGFTYEEKKKIALQVVSWEGGTNYSNFGQCYELSSAEHSITIGIGGWMGQQAQILLKRIRKEYPDTFKKYDTANISDDVDNANWGAYCITRGSDKYKAITNIISSDDGKKVQDDIIVENMENYIKEANERGVTDKKAVVMYIDVRHVFGGGYLQRDLLDRAEKPYTLESLYTVIMQHFSAIGTNNEAGYKNRHNSFKKFAEENF